jgi:hypothetical protein
MEEAIVFPLLSCGIGKCLFNLYEARKYSEDYNIPLRIVKSDGHEERIVRLFPTLTVQDNYPNETPYNICIKGPWKLHISINLFPDWKNALNDDTQTILESANLTTYDLQRNTWMLHVSHRDCKELIDYYMECIDAIPAGSRLHVYSDEPDMCRGFIEALTEDLEITVTWSKEMRSIAVLYEMAYCTGGSIIGNSSLAWWGAFFAHKRAVNMGLKPKAFYLKSLRPAFIPDWATLV